MSSVVLSPIGNGMQWMNGAGNVLSGGKIFTYAAGTTTPINSYTDASGSVLNANPIILDSTGKYAQEIWWASGTVAKIVVQDSAGVTQFTLDNIPGINDSQLTGFVAYQPGTTNVVIPGSLAVGPPISGNAITVNQNGQGTAWTAGTVLATPGEVFATGVLGGGYAIAGFNVTANAAASYVYGYSIGAGNMTLHAYAPNGVVVDAPTSGTAVTINGLSGANTLQVTGAGNGRVAINGTSGDASVTLQASGTNNSYLFFGSNGSETSRLTADSSGNFTLSNTASATARVQVAATGAVTINAPTSGNTLAISNLDSVAAITTSGTGGVTSSLYSNSTAGRIQFGASSNHGLSLLSNNLERLILTNAGNFTVNAPTSGTAVTINGLAGTNTLQVTGAANGRVAINGTSGDAGVILQASGTNNSYFFFGSNGSETARLTADSSGNFTLSNTASATARLYLTAAGNFTAYAPTSGTTLTVAPPASGGAAIVATGACATTPVALTYAAALTLDASRSNVFTLTLTGNVTSLSITNATDGQTINLFLTQDGTGSRTMPATWSANMKWQGGVNGVLSTAANAVDLATFIYRASNSTFYATLLKGFA